MKKQTAVPETRKARLGGGKSINGASIFNTCVWESDIRNAESVMADHKNASWLIMAVTSKDVNATRGQLYSCWCSVGGVGTACV